MSRAGVPRERIDDALRHVERWRVENRCPGLSVAVCDGADVLAVSGYGHRSLDPREPATEATRYAVASVTKPITGLATVLLADRHGIDLSEPVAAYVPYFETVPGEPITIHQLLTHTSGMPGDDFAFLGDEVTDWDEFRAFVASTTDRRLVDRTRWLYYNTGYAVLARLVEVVDGSAFSAFVDDAIFEPLGMTQSTFDHEVLGDRAADVMVPYSFDGEGFQRASIDRHELLTGAGGLVSSVEDLLEFVALFVADDPIIDPVLLRRTLTAAETQRSLVDGTRFSYGYGWEIRPFGSDTLVGHSGSTGVSGGFVGFLRDRGIGIAIGCNARAAADPAGLARTVLATLVDEDPASLDAVKSIEWDVQGLTGHYDTCSGVFTATVRWTPPHLELSIDGAEVSFTRAFLPTAIESGCYRFTSAEHLESTTDLEFFESGAEVELLFDHLLFRRVDSDDE